MRFAVGIPQLVFRPGFDPVRFRAYLVRAEELGFESAWVQEQLIGTAPLLHPLSCLSYAAACTTRIRLGCAVLVTPLHNPVHLAGEVATLDQLSQGRLEVGVVAGGKGRPYPVFGLSPEGAISRFNEGLQLMKALWTEPKVTFEGRFSHLEGVALGLKPVQRPHPPLWFGGNHPDALRRAALHGQGFIGAGSQSTARFADQVRLVKAALEELGTSGFRIAKRVYVAVDDDRGRARDQLAEALHLLYPHLPRDQAEAFAVSGPPHACIQALADVAAAGAELIVLTPLFDEANQMERLAAEVIPPLVRA